MERNQQLSDQELVILIHCIVAISAILSQIILQQIDCVRTQSSGISRRALHPPGTSAMSTFLQFGDDQDYAKYFRFNRIEFERLFLSFEEKWKRSVYGSHLAVQPACNRRKASAKMCLALALRFMASGILGDDGLLINGLSPATYSRTLWFGINLLYRTLLEDSASTISITPELLQESASNFLQKDSRVAGLCLLIDGKVHPAQNFSDHRQSRRNYNGMSDMPAKKGLYIFYANGLLAYAALAPGSWGDSRAFDHIRPILEQQLTSLNLWLGSDSAFPKSRWCFPMPKENAPPLTPEEQLKLAGMMHIRCEAEWGVGSITKTWRWLDHCRLPVAHSQQSRTVVLLWRLTMLLHQYRIRRMCIGQQFTVATSAMRDD